MKNIEQLHQELLDLDIRIQKKVNKLSQDGPVPWGRMAKANNLRELISSCYTHIQMQNLDKLRSTLKELEEQGIKFKTPWQ